MRLPNDTPEPTKPLGKRRAISHTALLVIGALLSSFAMLLTMVSHIGSTEEDEIIWVLYGAFIVMPLIWVIFGLRGTARSSKTRLAVLYALICFPGVTLSLWSYVDIDYPFVVRPVENGGVLTIYGVRPDLTLDQVIEKWGTPTRASQTYPEFRGNRRVVMKEGLVVQVSADRLERDGVPVLGAGIRSADMKKALGPGEKMDKKGILFRAYPDRDLGVAPASWIMPFQFEYTLGLDSE
jgi:hypothetical protein